MTQLTAQDQTCLQWRWRWSVMPTASHSTLLFFFFFQFNPKSYWSLLRKRWHKQRGMVGGKLMIYSFICGATRASRVDIKLFVTLEMLFHGGGWTVAGFVVQRGQNEEYRNCCSSFSLSVISQWKPCLRDCFLKTFAKPLAFSLSKWGHFIAGNWFLIGS